MNKSIRRTVGTGLVALGLMVPMASASAFEPPSDPQNTFTCVGGDPVPGHPGYPGVGKGLEQSSSNSKGGALAAWSAVFKGDGPIGLC